MTRLMKPELVTTDRHEQQDQQHHGNPHHRLQPAPSLFDGQ